MAAGTNPADIVGAERRVLQALCQGTPEGSVRETARAVLADYRWREPLHQIVFEVVLAIPSNVTEGIRSQLLLRLTRRGFPDVDIDCFLKPHGLSKQGAEHLIRDLGGLGPRQS